MCFRVFDVDGNPVSDEEVLADVGREITITAVPGRFVIGWTTPVVEVDGPGFLKFRDSAGLPIGADDPIALGNKVSGLRVRAADDRIGVLCKCDFHSQFEMLDENGDVIVDPVPLDGDDSRFLQFTGHEFLEGRDWRRIRPDGNPVNQPAESFGPFDNVFRETGQFDGYRFTFGLVTTPPQGGFDFFLETFRPPPEGYHAMAYNTVPTVTANTQNPGQPYNANLGQGLSFHASATSGVNGTTDAGDDQLTFEWDINGDGTKDFTGPQFTLSALQLSQFGIDTAGNFTIKLKVIDTLGLFTTVNVSLTVHDITPPHVRVVSPNGGESWPAGSSQVISWEATDDVGVDHFDLYYATDYNGSTGTWHLIATEPGSKSSHVFGSVPNVLSATARIRVVAVDSGNNSAEDISDGNLYFIQATTAAVKTLIVTHLGGLNALYPGTSGAVLSKLNELAVRDSVSGVILLLDNVPSVNAALNAWDAAHASNPATSEDEALAAAKSIHDYLWAPGTGQASSVFTQARYVVLVGEDKVLPFYRVKDSTGVLPESSYTELSGTSTVGAALKASVGAPGGYFLSDDYYGAAEAQETEVGAHELWLPDLAVGRLVQTPTEISAQVNRFIAQDGEVRPTKALVSGYDFVVDGAQDIAEMLMKPGVTVDSTLIGQLWTPTSLKCGLGLPNCSARPQLVSLNGHANHYQLGSAQGVVNATELASVTQTLAGAVVWGMGCHSGLGRRRVK